MLPVSPAGTGIAAGERRRWLPIDPQRLRAPRQLELPHPPAPPPLGPADTLPIPFGQCDGCTHGRHTWAAPGSETIGGRELVRYRCDCADCFGRCDGRQVRIAALADTPHHRGPPLPDDQHTWLP